MTQFLSEIKSRNVCLLVSFLGCYSWCYDVEAVSLSASGIHGSKSNDIKCVDSSMVSRSVKS